METQITQRYYRPELDVLRFFSFFFVFCAHRINLAGFRRILLLGFSFELDWRIWCPCFFLLNAFLITELLMREREQTGTVHPKSFYIRRMLRIWPLYFFTFYGNVIASYIFPNYVGHHLPPICWLAFTLFAGNWYVCAR